MRYSKEDHVFMVENMLKLNNCTLVMRKWRTKFKNRKAPSHFAIKGAVLRFRKHGSIQKRPPKHHDRSNRIKALKIQLANLYSQKPKLSIRKAACAVRISYSATRNILVNELHLFPYKQQKAQKLFYDDYEKRINFADWFLARPRNLPNWFITCDEAYFTLTEAFNKQNSRMWCESRPFDWIETPLHDVKIHVWCAISARRIYGPFYFSDSVNQHNYLAMLQNFFWPKLLRTLNYQKYYFAQDGATAHTANAVQNWLQSKFGSKFLHKSMWPPRSPDLNPCDYYLWGYLKSVVYNPLPETIEDLKVNIENEIRNIPRETLKSIFWNLRKRCILVKEAQGGHFESK